MLELTHRAPPVRPLTIQRQPPGHPHQPGAKPFAIPKLPEAAVGFDERLLGNILGVLTMSEDGKRDPEGERGRLGQAHLELALDILLHSYQPARQPIDVLVHRFITTCGNDYLPHVARRRPRVAGSLDRRWAISHRMPLSMSALLPFPSPRSG